jgi:hypothetical protein
MALKNLRLIEGETAISGWRRATRANRPVGGGCLLEMALFWNGMEGASPSKRRKRHSSTLSRQISVKPADVRHGVAADARACGDSRDFPPPGGPPEGRLQELEPCCYSHRLTHEATAAGHLATNTRPSTVRPSRQRKGCRSHSINLVSFHVAEKRYISSSLLASYSSFRLTPSRIYWPYSGTQ